MRSIAWTVLSLVVLLVVMNSPVVRAEQESEESSALASASTSSLPSPPSSSASLSSEEASEESSEVRSRRGGVRQFGGGKVTIISNNNKLVHIEEPKQRRSPAELEEQSRKSHMEEVRKRENDNRAVEKREQAQKAERADRERREKEAEETKKRQIQEEGDKKAAESKTKSELEERQKTAERERKEREAAEARQKQQEEQDTKKKAEEKEKNKEGVDADAQIEGNWRNYGNGYQNLRVGRWRGFVFVTGLLAGEGGHMATVPEKYRPKGGRLIFNLIKGNVDSRVDVLEDGRIFHIAGGGSSWLSLDGIFFPRRQFQGVELVGGWVNYGYGYRPTTQHKQGDLCMLSGLIRNGGWGYLGRMNSNCYPNQRLIFSANNHASIARVDVLPNGYFLYVAGSTNHGWLNLDGISFTTNPGQYLPLYNGWGNYGNGYRPASYSKNGRVCSVSGLIRSNWWNGHITTLPPGCRPASRLIFGGNVHIKSARIDVLENGAVVYVTGKAHWEWLSLDGIKFIAQR